MHLALPFIIIILTNIGHITKNSVKLKDNFIVGVTHKIRFNVNRYVNMIMLEINKHPVHERLPIALLLAMNSGFADAYTFQHQDDRFASLQTGNIIQAGIAIAKGNISETLSFVLPILFFILGACFNGFLKHNFKAGKLSTQQHSILVQILGITTVNLISNQISSTAVITLLSFFFAIQLDAFPKVRGLPFTSVMSTGNLRSIGANLATYFYKKDQQTRQNIILFSLIVLSFLFGALVSTLLSYFLHNSTLLGSSVILIVIFLLIFDFSKQNS